MTDDANCSIWDYRDNLRFDEPLGPGDERLVELSQARGNYSRKRLYRQLGVDTEQDRLRSIPRGQYLLFGGHRGCGKSTELRIMADYLAHPDRFFVVFIDAVKSLDVNNLRYSDVLLAQGEALAAALQEKSIQVPPVYLSRLGDWFAQRVKTVERTRSLAAELKAGAKAEGGVPLLFKLFAELTTAIRTGTSYKEEVRLAVRDSFSELADAFNTLVDFVAVEVGKRGIGKALLFVIDGTDRLQRDEAETFFIHDIHQLRLVRTNFVYCAPITILTEEGQAAQSFDATFKLPMVKLYDKGAAKPAEDGLRCLREFLLRRLPRDCFASEATADLLVRYSGGHPRDLLRLASYCLQEVDEGPIAEPVARTAVHRLATDYRRLVEPLDYDLLVRIDAGDKSDTPIGEQSRRLLYDLVLLEYNDFWWQSHPAVRDLPGYDAARAKSDRTSRA
jgi:energy-coupling factor transporter ATP-binding protein EcfA2